MTQRMRALSSSSEGLGGSGPLGISTSIRDSWDTASKVMGTSVSAWSSSKPASTSDSPSSAGGTPESCLRRSASTSTTLSPIDAIVMAR